MIIKMFNFWYFFWIVLFFGVFFGLYFLLKNKSDKTKKIVLSSMLWFGLLLHFLKCFIPPYSTDQARLYRDIWFINICAGNIFLFPFIFLSKSKSAKDYMFYIGVISGLLSMFMPLEPIKKVDQAAETLDIIRFYIHHAFLWIVPLLMVLLKLHTLSWKRVWTVPLYLLGLFLFIMLNQIFQSELGFVPLRGNEFFEIGYKNTSYIWGPDDSLGQLIAQFCPDIFKTVPVGPNAGKTKYWPFFWLVVPAFILITPICFGISLFFDWKNFKADVLSAKKKVADKIEELRR